MRARDDGQSAAVLSLDCLTDEDVSSPRGFGGSTALPTQTSGLQNVREYISADLSHPASGDL